MNDGLEQVGGLKWRLTLGLPAEELQRRVDTRLAELRRSVRLPGFRPGKVPLAELRRRFGEKVHRDQAERLAQAEVRATLGARGLRPVAAPQLIFEGLPSASEGPGSVNPQVVATFEVFPSLPDLDLATLEVQVPKATVGEVDIDRMLSRLRSQRCSWQPASRPSQPGDRLSLSLSARGAKGRWPRKGSRRVEQVVGQEGSVAFLGKALLGLEPGQRLERSEEPPTGSAIYAVTGATATVSILVNAVQAPQLPELDAPFVRSLGCADGQLDTLRRHLAETMEKELAEALGAERLFLVEKALVSSYPDLEIPESFLEAQTKCLAEAALEEGVPEPEAFASEAQRSLAATFLFAEVARQRGLVPDATRLWERTQELADRNDDPPAELDRIWGDGDLVQEIEEELLRQEVAVAVLAEAQVREVTMTFSELAAQRRERLQGI